MAAQERVASNQAELPVINPVADYEKIRRIGEVTLLPCMHYDVGTSRSVTQSLLYYVVRLHCDPLLLEQLHLHNIPYRTMIPYQF